MTQNSRIALGGIVLFLAVGAGAFGSHGLRGMVPPQLIEIWKTAVLYHLFHGLGLLVVAGLHQLQPSRILAQAWLTMLAGMLLFSGSLYLIVLTGSRWLGPITPLGGLTMMASWLLVSWAGLKHWKSK